MRKRLRAVRMKHAAHSNRPAHVARPGPAKAKRRPEQTACPDFAPGHFTALMRAHCWPPQFVPRLGTVEARNANGETAREVATRAREVALVAGRAHATGTIPMPGTPKNAKPLGWMR